MNVWFFVTYFSVLIPISVLVYTKAYKHKVFALLLFFLVFGFVIDTMTIGRVYYGFHAPFRSKVFWLVQFAILSTYFFMLARSKWHRAILVTFLIAYYLFFFTFVADIPPYWTAVELRFVGMILYILYCFWFYKDIMTSTPVDNILDYPYFWITSGFLIYFSGAFFIYIFLNKIAELYGGNLANQAYSIHNIINAVKNGIIAWGILKLKTQNK